MVFIFKDLVIVCIYFSKALLGVCLEGWGTYLLSQDEAAQAAQLLSRALKISKEVLGEDHEQV